MDKNVFASVERLQNKAISANEESWPTEFDLIDRLFDFAMESYADLADRFTDNVQSQAQKRAMTLCVDSVSSCMTAAMLARVGLPSDSWTVLRAAFETACLAEFLALNQEHVETYERHGEKILRALKNQISNKSVIRDPATRLFMPGRIIKILNEHDGEDRYAFYFRLSNFGAHASSTRSGLRMSSSDGKSGILWSEGHSQLGLCLTDIAAVLSYAAGIPFDPAVGLFPASSDEVVNRYETLRKEMLGLRA